MKPLDYQQHNSNFKTTSNIITIILIYIPTASAEKEALKALVTSTLRFQALGVFLANSLEREHACMFLTSNSGRSSQYVVLMISTLSL